MKLKTTLAAAATSIVLLTGCAGVPTITIGVPPAAAPATTAAPSTSSPSADPEPTQAKTGKYDQTWTKPYSRTYCTDWNEDMTAHEQWVMAGDFLVSLRDEEGVPDDADISTFQTLITSMCEKDGLVADAAQLLWDADQESGGTLLDS